VTDQQDKLPLVPVPDIIQRLLLPPHVIRIILVLLPPQRIALLEPVLEDVPPAAPVRVDVRARAPAVARMSVPALAECLLHDGAEGLGQDGPVGEVGGLQAARERAGVDGGGEGRAVAGEEGGVEEGEGAGLGFAFGGEVGVEPVVDAVAVEEGPVVLWESVVWSQKSER
jgi:hypothetical protein